MNIAFSKGARIYIKDLETKKLLQGNQSTIKLLNNGKKFSGKQ